MKHQIYYVHKTLRNIMQFVFKILQTIISLKQFKQKCILSRKKIVKYYSFYYQKMIFIIKQ